MFTASVTISYLDTCGGHLKCLRKFYLKSYRWQSSLKLLQYNSGLSAYSSDHHLLMNPYQQVIYLRYDFQ